MTSDEYHGALSEIERLSAGDPAPDTAEGMRLLHLVGEAEVYEVEHFPAMFRPSELRKIIVRLRDDRDSWCEQTRQRAADAVGFADRVKELEARRAPLLEELDAMTRALHKALTTRDEALKTIDELREANLHLMRASTGYMELLEKTKAEKADLRQTLQDRGRVLAELLARDHEQSKALSEALEAVKTASEDGYQRGYLDGMAKGRRDAEEERP